MSFNCVLVVQMQQGAVSLEIFNWFRSERNEQYGTEPYTKRRRLRWLHSAARIPITLHSSPFMIMGHAVA
jgi:hypothetical protein